MDHSEAEPKLILMPAFAAGAGAGRVVRWFVGEGDDVEAGDVIGEVASAAATFEIEADTNGRIAAILVMAGSDDVGFGTPLAALTSSVTADDRPQAPGEAPVAGAAPEPSRGASKAKSRSEAPADGQPSVAATIELTQNQALRDALAAEMRRDQDVLVIGQGVADAVGSYSPTAGLFDEFGPRRVVDTMVSPAALAGLAVGAAIEGLKPVVALGDWRSAIAAIEPIVNTAAKAFAMTGGEIKVPVVFRVTNASASRSGAQHAQCLAAWLAHTPGLKVVAPSCPADARALMTAAIRDPGPVVVVEYDALAAISAPVPEGDDPEDVIGGARTVRSGRHVTIVSYGRCVGLAAAAAATLAAEGIDAEIVDLRSLRPLDVDYVLTSVRRTGRLVTVEESWPFVTVGSQIVASVVAGAFASLVAPPARVSGADVAMPYAANLEALALTDVERIVSTVRNMVHGADAD